MKRDDATVDELIRLAGPRPRPDALATARVRAVVQAEWRRVQSNRARSRRWWAVAVAAAVVPAIVILGLWARPGRTIAPAAPVNPAVVATLEHTIGGVHAAAEAAPSRVMQRGDEIRIGALIETNASGRARFRMDGDRSVRLDVSTRLRFVSSSRLKLEQGRVYIDSPSELPALDGIDVETRHGIARDIGTQFEVSVDDQISQVRVREGTVRLAAGTTTVVLAALESGRVDGAARIERATAPKYGPSWSWIEPLAPQFPIEGATLESFLSWVSREQGWTWRFADAAAAKHAQSVVLHGTITGLTPAEALDAVLPTCGMRHELRRDRLVVAIASK